MSLSSRPPPTSQPMFAVQSLAFAMPSSGLGYFATDDIDTTSAGNQIAVLTATVQEGASSTTFTIPRTATVASDNKPHKVTVTIVEDLKPRFTYSVVPSKSANAFLKASLTNTTKDSPFLAGAINIFMDGNFVTTSNIKFISPQEEFALFLGVDSSIRVDFAPIKRKDETKGMVSKSNIQHVQRLITLKNNKSIEISVTVYDQLPLSEDEKIKVKLTEPVLKDAKESELKLNQSNNLEWRVKIKAGEKLEIPFNYTLEWPKDRENEIV